MGSPSPSAPESSLDSRVRIGIPLINDLGWQGGVRFVIHAVQALAALPPIERPWLALVVRECDDQALPLYSELFPIVDEICLLGFADDGRPRPRTRFVGDVEALFAHIDFLFPVHMLPLPGKPAATWIPDLQHHRMPDFFSAAEIEQRNQRLTAVAEQASVVVLSSHASRRDWERFYPGARPAVRVLPFHTVPDQSWYKLDPARVALDCGIDEPFLMCCNQFWIHKGHTTLIDALVHLAARGRAPLTVCTGSTEDYRDPDFFARLKDRLGTAGLGNRVRILGVIPRDQQMALMRQSLAVVQASEFEGWSTVVEDARVLGKTIVLSDIDVHLEQAPPHGRYFRVRDARDLAQTLSEILPSLRPGPELDRERQASEDAKGLLRAYARSICHLAREVPALLARQPSSGF